MTFVAPRRLPSALLVLALAGCAAAASVPAPPRFEMLRPAILAGAPPGVGPFPLVILLHGCGGRSDEGPRNRENAYRDALVSAGMAWLSVSSFPLEGRPFRSACGQPPGTIDVGERVEDLVAVLAHLDHYPRADRTRIGVLGFSMGASTTLTAVLGLDPARAPGLRSGVALYPSCRAISRDTPAARRPLLVMAGGRDTWTPAEPCVALVERLRGRGYPAEVVVYPEATHAWDNPGVAGGRTISMGPGRGTTFVRFDGEAARDSVTRAVAHFRATL